jgi:hypothetical protein
MGTGAVPFWEGERAAVRDFLLLLYACSVGFVSAGVGASFYKMITREDARFKLLGKSVPAAFTTFLFCALTGPMIITDVALKMVRSERNGLAWFCGSMMIAGMWSCCSGIVVLQLVLSLRHGIV